MEAPIGKEAEDLVEWTCQRAFLKDFVVRDSDFKRPGGDQREAADLLLVFGDEAVVFQVKHRPHPRKEAESEETYYDRLSRRYVEKAAGQLNTFKRALEERWLTEVKNGRGLTIPINSEVIKRTRGIVVLHLPAESELPEEKKTTMYSGVGEHAGMLVHAFLSDEFQIMLEELDTLPDFLLYLDFREQLYRAERVATPTRNLDLLAAYKLHHELRSAETQVQVTKLFVEDGLWEHYRKEYTAARRRRRQEDKVSYAIDRLIEDLAGTFEGYEATHGEDWVRTVYELARFTRMERRSVAEKWIAALYRAVEKGSAFTSVVFEHRPNEVVIVYAGPEEDRPEQMEFLASVAREHFCVERAIVLGTGPANAPLSTLQTLRLEGRVYTEEGRRKLRAAAKQVFGQQHEAKTYEFAPSEATPTNPFKGKSRSGKKPNARKRRGKRKQRRT